MKRRMELGIFDLGTHILQWSPLNLNLLTGNLRSFKVTSTKLICIWFLNQNWLLFWESFIPKWWEGDLFFDIFQKQLFGKFGPKSTTFSLCPKSCPKVTHWRFHSKGSEFAVGHRRRSKRRSNFFTRELSRNFQNKFRRCSTWSSRDKFPLILLIRSINFVANFNPFLIDRVFFKSSVL